MLDSPAYTESIPSDPQAHYPSSEETPFYDLYNYALSRDLGLIHLGKVVTALEQGEVETAYREWARHQRFWQMAAAGSISMYGVQNAITQLASSEALLQQMLQAYPGSRATARRHVLPVLAERPQLSAALARSQVFNFQIIAYYTDRLLQDKSLSTGSDRLPLLFLQRNATLNLAHRLFQNNMAQYNVALDGKIPVMHEPTSTMCKQVEKGWSSPDFWSWQLASNPAGILQLCGPSNSDAFTHAAKIDAATKEIERMLAL